MHSLLPLLVIVYFPFLAGKLDNQSTRADLVQWSCEDPVWLSPPGVTDGVFTGQLQASCAVVTNEVANYESLYPGTLANIVAYAKPLHSGPTPETFEGMDSNAYDLTSVINQQGLESVRSIVHGAWNKSDEVLVASYSTEITATGLASNIIQLNTRTSAKRLDSTHHVMVIWNETQVSKPNLVPIGIFKKQVMNQMTDGLKGKEEDVIKSFAEKM